MMGKPKRKTESDYGTPESWQHGKYIEEETMVAGVKRKRNITTDQIATLHNAGKINDRQKNIAEEYAALCLVARKMGHAKCANLNAVGGAGESEKMLNAWDRLLKTDRALGPLRNVIRYVCVDGYTPVEWEDERKNAIARKGHGLFILKEALDYLGEHWGR